MIKKLLRKLEKKFVIFRRKSSESIEINQIFKTDE